MEEDDLLEATTEEVTDDLLEETEADTEETTEVEAAVENVENQEQTEEVAEEQESEKPFMVAKYMHADLLIATEEEAKALVQLGHHYKSKIEPEYNALKAIKEPFGKIENIAVLYGMSVDELHNTLMNQYYESQAESQGLTPEQVKKEYELSQREQSLKQVETAKQTEVQQLKMLDELFAEYPELNFKIESIPQEVLEQMFAGKDLMKAYQAHEIKQLKSKTKQLEQNKDNRQKGPIKSATANGTDDHSFSLEDDFLNSFK